MTQIPAFPKPSQMKKSETPWFREFADGRIVFNLNTKKGRDAYKENVRLMFERQGRRCGLTISEQCKERKGKWPLAMMTFDHSQCRGMGGAKRTDVIVGNNKENINMAVCIWCNSLKSSRPLSDFDELVP